MNRTQQQNKRNELTQQYKKKELSRKITRMDILYQQKDKK